MNKQELIEGIEAIPDNIGLIRQHIDKKLVLGLVRQLDEPEKVKVPQLVADWIEYCKKNNFTLLGCLDPVDDFGAPLAEEFEGDVRKCLRWCRKESNNFARAWLDGYEVEKEKRYLVKLKAVDQYLVSVKDENFLGFLQSRLRSKFTRKELEDLGFGWVFDCEGIEIEEVEE